MGFFIFLLIAVFYFLATSTGLARQNEIEKERDRQRKFREDNEFELRVTNDKLTIEGKTFLVKRIEGIGFIPIPSPMPVTFITKLFDRKEKVSIPVRSQWEQFASGDTNIFQLGQYTGDLTPDHRAEKWVTLAVIPLDSLLPPYSGKRVIDASVSIRSPNPRNNPSWQGTVTFNFDFSGKGYKELEQDQIQGNILLIHLAVAVAGSDGLFDKAEGLVLKQWITDKIEKLESEERERQKKLYNNAFRSAYKELKDGTLSVGDVAHSLNGIGEEKQKYEAITLCYEILAADGRVDPAELQLIRKIAESLDLDEDTVDLIKDRTVLGLKFSSRSGTIEDLVGIEKDWDAETKKKYLRKEFQKWNNRISVLEAGEERDNAQKMLDRVAEARKLYD